jgi:hypothetical protein
MASTFEPWPRYIWMPAMANGVIFNLLSAREIVCPGLVKFSLTRLEIANLRHPGVYSVPRARHLATAANPCGKLS